MRPRRAAAEEVAEDVAEDVLEAGGGEIEAAEAAALLEGGVAEAVVLGALLGIAQHLVGLGGFLEALLGGLVAGIAVGVVLQRDLAVGLLDLVGAGAAADAQDFVVVALSPPHRISAARIQKPSPSVEEGFCERLTPTRVRDRAGRYSLTSSKSASTTSSRPPPGRPAPPAPRRAGRPRRAAALRCRAPWRTSPRRACAGPWSSAPSRAFMLRRVVALERRLGLLEGLLDVRLRGRVDLAAVLVEVLLGLVDQAVELVARLDRSRAACGPRRRAAPRPSPSA